MKENKPFTFLGMYSEISAAQHIVRNFTDSDWANYAKRRQTKSVAGGHTDTIPLIYSTVDSPQKQEEHFNKQLFDSVLGDIVNIYGDYFSECSIGRAFLARMHPFGEIKRHKDVGVVSAKTHRIHLPIFTNEDCLFTVGESTIHMREGELWIIDNTDQYHSVINGNTHRIHLIVDVY